MNERELLEAMGEMARQQDKELSAREDKRWARFCAGQLSAEEETELRAEANRTEAGKAALEAFRPLGEDFHARTVSRLATEIGAAGIGAAPSAAVAESARPATGATQGAQTDHGGGAKSNVVSFFRQRMPGRVPMALAAGLVAALAIAVFMNGPAGSGPLPDYGLAFEGQVMQMRTSAPEEGPLVLAHGNRLHLLLTPDTAVDGPLEIRVIGEHGGTVTDLALPTPQYSQSGSVLIEGRIGSEIRMPTDLSALIVVLGRPGTLPANSYLQDELAAQGQIRSEDWKAWRLPMRMD